MSWKINQQQQQEWQQQQGLQGVEQQQQQQQLVQIQWMLTVQGVSERVRVRVAVIAWVLQQLLGL
jgi:hypothetical protein